MEPSRYYIRRSGDLPAEAPIETEASPVFVDPGQPLIDISQYWRIVLKRYRMIIAILVGVVMLVMIKTMTETPIYTAETTIMIQPAGVGDGSNTLEDLVQIEAAANDTDLYYKTQCAILESRALAASVIKSLDLQQDPAFVGAPVKPGVFDRVIKRIFGGAHPAAHPTKKVRIGAELDNDLGVPAGLVHAYQAALSVKPMPDTDLIKISFSWSNPALAARIANAHVLAYERRDAEMHGQANEEAERYLQNKLLEVKDHLEKSEAALNDYRREKGIIPGLISLDGKDAVILDRLSALSADLTKAQVARISLEAQIALIHKHDYNSLAAVLEDPEIQSANKALDGLYTQRAALANQFKDSYPPLAKLDAQIREMQARIALTVQKKVTAIQSQYDEAVEKEKDLQAEMELQRQETLKLNDSAAQYSILQRDVDTNRELYNAILKRVKDVEVSGDTRNNDVSIINSAEIPGAPTSPNKSRNFALSIFGGLGLGLAAAFMLEMLDNTLKNPEEAEQYLRLPNLGVVPEFSSINGKSAYAPRELPQGFGAGGTAAVLPPGRELVTTHGTYSRVGEAYRNLRTALLMSRAGGPPKVTLFTSATSREGKTVTSVNMAVMLAQLGGPVLLIDADLRRARCHRVLAVDNHLGLTEVLTGAREPGEMVRTTEIENLHFLGSGSVPPNPTELLNSKRMIELIGQFRETYEYIVIDCAPVLPVSDAMVLAKLTDGVVVVANGSATPRQQVRTACARLEYARAKILGVVLNKIKLHSHDYHYYYHQDYYAYGADGRADEDEYA